MEVVDHSTKSGSQANSEEKRCKPIVARQGVVPFSHPYPLSRQESPGVELQGGEK